MLFIYAATADFPCERKKNAVDIFPLQAEPENRNLSTASLSLKAYYKKYK